MKKQASLLPDAKLTGWSVAALWVVWILFYLQDLLFFNHLGEVGPSVAADFSKMLLWWLGFILAIPALAFSIALHRTDTRRARLYLALSLLAVLSPFILLFISVLLFPGADM